MTKEIDLAFIARVYKTSFVVWAFGALVLLSFSTAMAVVGWTVGSAMSFGVLRSLQWAVTKYFVPGNTMGKNCFSRFSAAKLLVIVLILSILLIIGGRNFEFVGFFCGGLILTQAIIILKVIGSLLTKRYEQ